MYLRRGSGLQLDEGPEPGTIVGPFDEIDELTDDRFRVPDPEAPLTLLLFASPHCAICKDVLQGLGAVVHHYDVSPVVVSEGTSEENDELRQMVGSKGRFVTSVGRQRALRIETLPYGVVVRRDGLVLARRIVNHLDADDRCEADEGGERGDQRGSDRELEDRHSACGATPPSERKPPDRGERAQESVVAAKLAEGGSHEDRDQEPLAQTCHRSSNVLDDACAKSLNRLLRQFNYGLS